MMRRIGRAYLNEAIQLSRLGAAYVGPVLIVAVACAAPLVYPIEDDGRSDYDYIAYATQLALNIPGVLVLIAFSAGLISPELGDGSIRLVLVRPLYRSEYLAAKFLAGVSYAVILSAIAAVAVWITAFLLGDLVGVQFGGELLYTDGEMRTAYLVAYVLGFLPYMAAVSLALFVSTCTRNTSAAITASIAAILLLDTFKYPLHIAPFVFTTYLDAHWQVFADRAEAIETPWLATAYFGAGVSVLTTIVFFGGAAGVLSRRNLSG